MTRIEKTIKDISDLYDFYIRIKKVKGANKRKSDLTTRSTRRRHNRLSS